MSELSDLHQNTSLNQPWLDDVPSFIRKVVPGAKSLRGPTIVHALYDANPDRRATLRYATDDAEHPEVVVKVNLFPLLAGSAEAHRLVSRCSPSNVPKVLAINEFGEGSMILFATFDGRPIDAASGPAALRELPKTLGQIQVACSIESANANGLETIKPGDILRKFDECLANIHTHFAAWEFDDGKIARAMGFAGAEVLSRLEPLRPKVARWIEVLEEPDIELSVEHGDCHAGNATCLADGTMLIFDWENSTRTHPFLSAEKLLTSGWAMDTDNSSGPWGYVRHFAESGRDEDSLSRRIRYAKQDVGSRV